MTDGFAGAFEIQDTMASDGVEDRLKPELRTETGLSEMIQDRWTRTATRTVNETKNNRNPFASPFAFTDPVRLNSYIEIKISGQLRRHPPSSSSFPVRGLPVSEIRAYWEGCPSRRYGHTERE
jgi:hypothetical protein